MMDKQDKLAGIS